MTRRDRAATRPRRRWLWLVGLGVVVITAWLGFAAYQLVQARNEAQAGIDRLESLRDTMTTDSLLTGAEVATLEGAVARFAAANDHARSPALAPLRFVPVVGRQVRSVDDLTDAAEDVSNIAIDQLGKAQQLVATADGSAGSRVATTAELTGIAADAEAALAAIDLGPSDGLVGPLDRARRRFDDELESLQGSAANIAAAGASLERLLTGPSRYLLLAANNSEMRVGAPSFLSVGVLQPRAGALALSEVRSVTEYQLPANAVPLEEDMAARWGWLAPNADFRNLMSSPRFDANAALAAQMWATRTGEAVEGVLALDLVALQGLLAATGPVSVDGVTIGADNVLQYLMVDQYAALEATGAPDSGERRERLSAVAQAVVDQVDRGDWDLVALVDELTRAVEGRHLMLWSSDAAQQDGWEAVRAGGTLGPDSLLLGVHNRGGNKLDQFLSVEAEVEARRPGLETEVTVTVTLRNDAPADLPAYVSGPFPGAADGAEGRYQGLVVLQLPARAGEVTLSDGADRVADGPDGPDTRVVATYVQVDRGQEQTVTFTAALPGNGGDLRIEPSARTPGVGWRVGDLRFDDSEARVIVIADHVE